MPAAAIMRPPYSPCLSSLQNNNINDIITILGSDGNKIGATVIWSSSTSVSGDTIIQFAARASVVYDLEGGANRENEMAIM